MLFPVVEVTRLLSNLIKSGFVAFSQDNTLVIDTNKNKIIKSIDDAVEEIALSEEDSVEEVLAEALIRDAELEGADFGDDLLTMDTSELPDFSTSMEGIKQIADKVVKSAKEEADSIVGQAHNEAEQMRASAYDEAERIKQQAKEEGYETGYNEGMAAAQQELQRKSDALEQRIQEAELELQEKEENLVKDTECKMVDLLCHLIPSVTGVVIENQREVLLYLINNAMQDLDNSKKFVIKISSDDYEIVEEHKEEIYGALNPNIELEIFEDAKLAPMQCLIETDNGIVDVSLDVQLYNLITALKLMVKDKE